VSVRVYGRGLARLDAIMAALAQVKAELAALMPPAVNGAGSEGADDLAPRGWRAQTKALRAAGCERI
jgi:hypothetical protein